MTVLRLALTSASACCPSVNRSVERSPATNKGAAAAASSCAPAAQRRRAPPGRPRVRAGASRGRACAPRSSAQAGRTQRTRWRQAAAGSACCIAAAARAHKLRGLQATAAPATPFQRDGWRVKVNSAEPRNTWVACRIKNEEGMTWHETAHVRLRFTVMSATPARAALLITFVFIAVPRLAALTRP